MQKRRNSSASAMELRIFCIRLSILLKYLQATMSRDISLFQTLMSVCLIHSCIALMGHVRTQCLVTTVHATLGLKAGYATQVG